MAEFSLELNEDQQQIQKWVHDFAEQVVRPAGHEWDEREETPWPVIEEAAKIGLYSWEFMAQCFSDPTGLLFPIVSEEMCWGDAGISLAIFGSTLGAAGIAGNGTPEQIAEWVPQCFGTPDDIHLASFAVTEPGAGSDVSSLRTNAKKDGDDWVINGQKTFITNGGLLDRPNVHVVVASVDPELGARGHASFVVPPGTPGLTGGKSAKVQAAMSTFETTRPIVGAQALGIARAAYEFALDYAKDREAFGRKIIENQGIAFKLADMKMEIDAARLLVWRAAWMGATKKKFENGEGSMSKLKAGEVAVWATEQAIQILGGYGYIRDFPAEQWHRDSKIYTLFEGTS